MHMYLLFSVIKFLDCFIVYIEFAVAIIIVVVVTSSQPGGILLVEAAEGPEDHRDLLLEFKVLLSITNPFPALKNETRQRHISAAALFSRPNPELRRGEEDAARPVRRHRREVVLALLALLRDALVEPAVLGGTLQTMFRLL